MDGAVERDIPERGVAFHALTREQDDGFGAIVVNGFDALRRIGFQQFDGWPRREVGVPMGLQNRQECRFIRRLRGGAQMPAVREFFVLWPDGRRIELVGLAETDVLWKEKIRAQSRLGAFREDRIAIDFHLVKSRLNSNTLGCLVLSVSRMMMRPGFTWTISRKAVSNTPP